MPILFQLQGAISGIHSEKEHHQDDLGNQDIVCIASWPAIEFLHRQPFYFHNISPDKENKTTQQHQYSQHFKSIYQQSINISQRTGKKTMCTQDAIQYYLQYFYIDNDKAGIDKEMKNGHQWVAEHFFLAKSDQ